MQKNTHRVLLILGAADPEMEAIEALALSCGAEVVYATSDREGVNRVTPREMYEARGVSDETALILATSRGGVIVAVECLPGRESSYGWERTGLVPGLGSLADCAALVVRADHHRGGDAGYGLPPEEFMAASSIGQVIRHLARAGQLCWPSHRRIGYAIQDGEICHVTPGGWEVVTYGHDHEESWFYYAATIPHELVMVAAADHCLGAAYRGECPGVRPEALLAWRIASRAKNQNRPEEGVRADIERAREALLAAPMIEVGQHTHTEDHDWSRSVCDGCAIDLPLVRDMRAPTPIPELVEAAMIERAEYMSGPLIDPRDPGRAKFTVSGLPATVRAWMVAAEDQWELTDIYGDPARGFAGGYRAP